MCGGLQLHPRRRPWRDPARGSPSPLAQTQEVKGFLDEYVIGQEQTKKKLAVAVYNHYKRIQMNRTRGNDVELSKSTFFL